MSLMRWFRKNNKKLMAVVVIVLMLVFVGSAWLTSMGKRQSTGRKSLAAYYGEKHKITNYDLAVARQELEVLRMLGADSLIRPQDLRFVPSQDMRVILLGELLFAEQSGAAETSGRIKQIVIRDGHQISNDQIDAVYRKPYPPGVYWFLLKNEARAAGLRIPNDEMKNQLSAMLPRLRRGATYASVINSIVSWQGVSEEQILQTFGNLLAVIEYAKMMCSMENLTVRQVKQMTSRSIEGIDVEYVRFEPSIFLKDVGEAGDQETARQFDRYRDYFVGEVSEENPYGFGYKLRDSVQLEYLVIKLDDVAGVVEQPTQEEAEEYYQRNRASPGLVEQVPSDPNDPNSALTERTKSFAEVAELISKSLLENKVSTKAEQLIQEARTLTEAALETAGAEPTELSAEKYRELAGDYQAVAEELSEKYDLPVYSGQTGMLNAIRMQSDEYLGMLYVRTAGGASGTSLVQMTFAIDELGSSKLGAFDAAKPRMYQNIGPLRDLRTRFAGYAGRIMALVRVTGARKAHAPESVDYTFNTATIKFGEQQTDEDSYSVREKVANDLKKLAALDTTRARAEEFIKEAQTNGWESTVDKFNELYASSEQAGEPNAADEPEGPFRLTNQTGMARISNAAIQTLKVRNEGDAMGQAFIYRRIMESKLIEKLYSLVPPDSNSLDTVPVIVEFAPGMGFYCIKELSVGRLYREDYELIKARQAYMADLGQAQTLAAVHYNPENIVKRMDFRAVKSDEQTAAEEASDPMDEGGGEGL